MLHSSTAGQQEWQQETAAKTFCPTRHLRVGWSELWGPTAFKKRLRLIFPTSTVLDVCPSSQSAALGFFLYGNEKFDFFFFFTTKHKRFVWSMIHHCDSALRIAVLSWQDRRIAACSVEFLSLHWTNLLLKSFSARRNIPGSTFIYWVRKHLGKIQSRMPEKFTLQWRGGISELPTGDWTILVSAKWQKQSLGHPPVKSFCQSWTIITKLGTLSECPFRLELDPLTYRPTHLRAQCRIC